jgi:hypothetical protein
MAFTGTPVIQQLNDRTVRITGVSLALSTAGTIGLTGATGTPPDITLPANFRAAVYSYNGSSVPLQASIQCWVEPVTIAGVTNLPPSVGKTGTAVTDFRITITNTNTGLATQDLEILVISHMPYVGAPAQIA